MPPHADADWFAEHVQPHEAMLRAWLANRFGSQLSIDDIVQEAYMRVWRAHVADELHSPNSCSL